MKTIGIMAAMHDEIAGLVQEMGSGVEVHRIGQRDYYVGELHGQRCVVVLARIGKVAAAATTVTLIREFAVQEIIFTGLAGAVSSDVRVGDVVLAQSLLQHDINASPLFPQYEIPLLGRSHFQTDPGLNQRLTQCLHDYFEQDFGDQLGPERRRQFGLDRPAVHQGTIISGDQFVGNIERVRGLRAALPDALCVEMEGAAVAQICYEYDLPFAVLRTISDSADESAGIDFSAFLEHVARVYSTGILRRYLVASGRKSVLQN